MNYKELERYCIDEGIKNAGKATGAGAGTSAQEYYKGISLAFMWIGAQLQNANREEETIEEEVAGGFSERLKPIIDALNVSQKELAELIGVTEVTMSRYVNGQRMPKAPILVKLAKELGVTVDWLMGAE